METYQTFSVSMDSTKITEKLKLKVCNDSVTPNIKKKARNDLDG